jgi:hypothetical protein
MDFEIREQRLMLDAAPAELAPLVVYWNSKRRGHQLPARSDIDPLEMKPLLGKVSLVQVNRVEPKFVFRLWGTAHVYRPGMPKEGAPVEALRPRAYAAMCRRHYELAATEAASMLHDVSLGFEQESWSYQRVLLPLAADGETVDMLISASCFDSGRQQMFFEAWQKREAVA